MEPENKNIINQNDTNRNSAINALRSDKHGVVSKDNIQTPVPPETSEDNTRGDGDVVSTTITPSNQDQKKKNEIDLDKLAVCVAKHETANCTKGSAKYNNAFGIMEWPNGKRRFKRYATCADSYIDFKRIWDKSYGGLPTLAKAKKYSGNDRSEAWFRNVNNCYYN